MMINKFDVQSWENDPVTRHFKSLLEEAKKLYTEQILSLNNSEQASFFKDYYFIRGQIAMIDSILEAELLQQEDITNEDKEI